MTRPPAQFSPESVDEVLGYVKAAAVRDPTMFRPGGHKPETRVLQLARDLTGAEAAVRHLVLGDWVLKNLRPEGRTRMRAALRRRRADAKGARAPVALRMRPNDAWELQDLAKRLDMPATLLVRSLVAIAAADKELCTQAVTLAVAMKLGEARSPREA